MIYLLICVFYIPPSTLAQTIQWQPEQQISFDTIDAFTPRVFAIGDTVHIFWIRPNGRNCYYVRSTNGGMTFSPPRTVYADSGVLRNSGSTNNIAVYANNLYLLWRTCDTCDAQHEWVTFRRSTDAGQTFEPYQRLFPAHIGWAITTDDSVVVFRWTNRSLTQDWLALSFDYGMTWQHSPFWFRNFQQLWLNSSDLHLTQTSEGTLRPEVSYRYSNDVGITWGPEVILSAIDIYPSDQMHLLAPSGVPVFIGWNDGKYGTTNGLGGSIIMRQSTDRGTTWQEEMLLTDIPSGLWPRIAADNEIVAVGWENSGQPFQGISMRLSLDTGLTWGPHIPTSDSAIQASGTDFSISKGNVFAVWSDSRTGRSQISLRRGTIVTTSVPDQHVGLTEKFILLPNYPNPFNAATVISYSLPKQSKMRLSVYDILGRERAVLVAGSQQRGIHRVTFKAEDFSSGMYIVRLQTDETILAQKILVLK